MYCTIRSNPAEAANSCAPVGRGSPETDPTGSLGWSKGCPSGGACAARGGCVCNPPGLRVQS
eukprot:12040321-Alexandrium_andersonii.AAC.1